VGRLLAVNSSEALEPPLKELTLEADRALVAAAEKVAGKKGKGSEVTKKCIDMFKGLEMKGSILHLNIISLSWVSLVVLLAKNSLAMRET
jgi:hypothetical protein